MVGGDFSAPKGSDIADVATFESIAKDRIRNLLHDRFRKSGPMKIIGFLELGMKASDRDGIFLHGFSSGSKKRDTGRPILRQGDIDGAVDTLFAKLNADVTEYEGRGSGWLRAGGGGGAVRRAHHLPSPRAQASCLAPPARCRPCTTRAEAGVA